MADAMYLYLKLREAVERAGFDPNNGIKIIETASSVDLEG